MEEIMERQERRHICIIHPPLLNNNYCKSCETVCCSLCVKSNHSGNLHSVIPNISLEHDLVQTATKELVTALDKVTRNQTNKTKQKKTKLKIRIKNPEIEIYHLDSILEILFIFFNLIQN